jgi:hypothetical protein
MHYNAPRQLAICTKGPSLPNESPADTERHFYSNNNINNDNNNRIYNNNGYK